MYGVFEVVIGWTRGGSRMLLWRPGGKVYRDAEGLGHAQQPEPGVAFDRIWRRRVRQLGPSVSERSTVTG